MSFFPTFFRKSNNKKRKESERDRGEKNSPSSDVVPPVVPDDERPRPVERKGRGGVGRGEDPEAVRRRSWKVRRREQRRRRRRDASTLRRRRRRRKRSRGPELLERPDRSLEQHGPRLLGPSVLPGHHHRVDELGQAQPLQDPGEPRVEVAADGDSDAAAAQLAQRPRGSAGRRPRRRS